MANTSNLSDAVFKKMSNSINGAVCSFGDTALMQQALAYIYATPHGKKIISGLKNPPALGSARSLISPNNDAEYNLLTHSITLKSSYISSKNPAHTAKVLRHEILHAYQKERGIDPLQPGFNIEESVWMNKVMEAEADAHDRIFDVTCSKIDDNGKNPNKNLKEFMQEDLIQQYKDSCKKNNVEPNLDHFKQTNVAYLLQQELLKTNGNRALAEKRVAGKLIVQNMNINTNNKVNRFDPVLQPDYEGSLKWQKTYDDQAFCTVVLAADKGMLTQKGNPKAVNNALRYFNEEYGIKPSAFKQPNGRLNLNLSEHGENLLAAAKDELAPSIQKGATLAGKTDSQKAGVNKYISLNAQQVNLEENHTPALMTNDYGYC